MTPEDKGYFEKFWAKRQQIEREKEAMRLRRKSGKPLEDITARFMTRVDDPNTPRCDKCGEMFMLNRNNRLVHDYCPAIVKQVEQYEQAKKGEVSSDTELTPPRRSYMDEDDE